MIKNLIIKWIFLGLIIVLNPVLMVCAQDEKGKLSPETLEFTISTDSKAYLPLQQVMITTELKNISDKTIKLPSGIEWACYCAASAIYIAKKGEEFDLRKPYRPSMHIIGGGQRVHVEVKSGEAHVTRLRLVQYPNIIDIKRVKDGIKYEYGDIIFTEPGSYKILCVYRKKFNSNIITIQINEPQGNDKKAYEHLKKLSEDKDFLADFLTWPVPMHDRAPKIDIPKKIKELEEFLALYPESDYTPYVQWTLGRYYRYQGSEEKAIGILKKVIDLPERWDFVDHDDAMGYIVKSYCGLARAARKKKRLDEAEKHIKEAEKWLIRLEKEGAKTRHIQNYIHHVLKPFIMDEKDYIEYYKKDKKK